MSSLRIPSPARSECAAATTLHQKPRRTGSVDSPALSNVSDRLTSMIQERNMGSFVLSPLVRRSMLTDNTNIEEPARKSWWKILDENSRDANELLEGNDDADPNNIHEEMDIEILSQEKKDYTFDLPESSDSESINSIVIPQRRLFTEKENQVQRKFGQFGTRDTLNKLHKTNTAASDDIASTGPKQLFQNKPRSKPFSAALLNISPNKTTGDKTMTVVEPKGQTRNIFGYRQGTKRKNMFADFIVSESEDEIPDIQPKVFGFPKKADPIRRGGSSSRCIRDPSPTSSITTDMELDHWKLLPSSTMVENQLEAMMVSDTPKKAQLSKLSEAKESDDGTNSTETANKTKHSNKSISSKTITKNNTKKKSPDTSVSTRSKYNKVSEDENKQMDENESRLNKSQHTSPINDYNNSQTSVMTRSRRKSNLVDKNASFNISQNNSHKINTSIQTKKSNEKSNISTNENLTKNMQNVSNRESVANITNYNHDETKNEASNDNIANQDENCIIEKTPEENEPKAGTEVDEIGDMEQNKLVNAVQVVNENQNAEIVNQDVTRENDNANKSKESINEVKKYENNQSQKIETEDDGDNIEEKSQEQELSQKLQDVSREEQNENESEEEQNIGQEKQNECQEELNISQEEQNESGEKQSKSMEELNENQNEENISQEELNESQDVHNETQDEENEIPEEQSECEEEEELSQNESHEEQNTNHEIQSENDEEENESEAESEPENDSHEVEIESEDEEQNISQEEIVQNEISQEIECDEQDNSENQTEQDQTDISQEMEYDQENESDDEAVESDQNESNNHEMHSEDGTHDSTGRNRKKVESPEVVRHDTKTQADSFTVRGRNTSVRKTRTIENLDIRPNLEPVTESISSFEASKNSSAEGSGWDSHRTTRKTLRQTFGKDFTPRKSLRAWVMEKSAKRHTMANEGNITGVTGKFPLANSTELAGHSSPHDDDGTSPEPLEDHEVSSEMTLEMCLKMVQQKNMERRLKIEDAVLHSLKAPSKDTVNPFKVPARPAFLRHHITKPAKPKAKKRKALVPLEWLPTEVVEDMKYKPPKRFQPTNAAWINKRLYKYIETKLEPKYDYKARVRAEKLVESLYHFAKDLRRRDTASLDSVSNLKREMARLKVVNTHFQFYEFVREFMPKEVKIKVVPDVVNNIPLPRNGVFSEIL